jgi:hypothetical protein
MRLWLRSRSDGANGNKGGRDIKRGKGKEATGIDGIVGMIRIGAIGIDAARGRGRDLRVWKRTIAGIGIEITIAEVIGTAMGSGRRGWREFITRAAGTVIATSGTTEQRADPPPLDRTVAETIDEIATRSRTTGETDTAAAIDKMPIRPETGTLMPSGEIEIETEGHMAETGTQTQTQTTKPKNWKNSASADSRRCRRTLRTWKLRDGNALPKSRLLKRSSVRKMTSGGQTGVSSCRVCIGSCRRIVWMNGFGGVAVRWQRMRNNSAVYAWPFIVFIWVYHVTEFFLDRLILSSLMIWLQSFRP